MTDAESEADWKLATWTGNRLLQHLEFQALSFREKVLAIEEMQRVSEALRIPDSRRQQHR